MKPKVLRLEPKFTDEEMKARYRNTMIEPSMIDTILAEDADVYDAKTGKLLLLFRKRQLPIPEANTFYDNVIDFVRKRPTSLRYNAKENKIKTGAAHQYIHSVVVGFFDRLSFRQNAMLKMHGVKLDTGARATEFNIKYPEKYDKVVPYVTAVDDLYKRYVPDAHKRQYAKAKETPYKVGDTSFSTVTVNLNYRTTIHKDKKDDPEGFGNLTVIERGKYAGAETCMPQWGVGVDVRQGDILFMDVHEWHGNLPMKPLSKGAERMSVVCYFMPKIWEQTKHMSAASLKRNTQKLVALRASSKNNKTRRL